MPCPPAVENKALRPKFGIELELLNVYYCNARSLRNNLGELHDLLYSGKFKIICFAESWLCSKLFNDMTRFWTRKVFLIFTDATESLIGQPVVSVFSSASQCNRLKTK
jgi:hypothetical protein